MLEWTFSGRWRKSFKKSESRICSTVSLSSGFLFKHPDIIISISGGVEALRGSYLHSETFFSVYSLE